MLVNAYLAYHRFMVMKGATPLSHYKWRVKVVLGKICPEKYGPPKSRASVAMQRGDQHAINRASKRSRSVADDDTASTRASAMGKSSKKLKYLTVAKIDDPRSELNVNRLSTDLRHLAEPAGRTKDNGITCQLCRWATSKKLSSQLLRCNDCGVNLCAWCFEPFHTAPVFNEEFQESLCTEILARNPSKPKRGANIKIVNQKKNDMKGAKSKRKK